MLRSSTNTLMQTFADNLPKKNTLPLDLGALKTDASTASEEKKKKSPPSSYPSMMTAFHHQPALLVSSFINEDDDLHQFNP